MTLEVREVSPQTVGGLMMLFQIATVFAGALYGVDPLGQPGVELGKRIAYRLLGREGFGSEAVRAGDRRWRVEVE